MPRRKVTALPTDNETLIDPAKIEDDPAPRTARGGRPRKAAPRAAGNRGRIPARTTAGRIMSEAQMVTKVRSELATWISLGAATWEFRDPECAASLYTPMPDGSDRIEALADRLTAIVARNKTFLTYAAKTGVFGDIAALAACLYPVAKTVWTHHGPSATGHERDTTGGGLDAFPAYSGSYGG